MIPDCPKCGEPMRLFWSFSNLKGEKWVTDERYYCECGYEEDREILEPFWKLCQLSSST